MLTAILDVLEMLVFGTNPTQQHSHAVPEKKFSIGHSWPFPSPKPANEESLVAELIKGVEKEGEHVFYFWGGQKRRHLRNGQGRETVLAKHIVWWMEGRKCPTGSLVTTCGESKCIRLDHLALKAPQIPYGPAYRGQLPPRLPIVRTPKASQPPKPPKIDNTDTALERRFTKGDRSQCDTRKAYFADEINAERFVSEYNRPENRGTRPRQYAYPCTQCDGWHASKIDPKKFNKKKTALGSVVKP